MLDLETGAVVSGVLTVGDAGGPCGPVDAEEEARLVAVWEASGLQEVSITGLARLFGFNRTTRKYREMLAGVAPDRRGRDNQCLYGDATVRGVLIPRVAGLRGRTGDGGSVIRHSYS